MDFVKPFVEKCVYPLMEGIKGNHIRAYTGEQLSVEQMSAGELEALRLDALARLLDHCLAHVPAYRDLPITPEQIAEDPAGALRRVPVLTKAALRDGGDRYISELADKSRLTANISGGSTGEAVRFFIDRATVERYEAARWCGLSRYGISYGSRSVMLWGNPIELNQQQSRKYFLKEKWLKNRVLISAYALSPDKIREHIAFINRYRPEYIYGYASSLTVFADQMLKEGLSLSIPLKAVVSTAETLFPHQRETIGLAFRCPVANEYGARDAGILAYECPEGGIHLAAANLCLEILDPVTHAPLPTGQSGIAVVTDLGNFAMPRLRYALGDVLALSDQPCPCGRSTPLLSSISGREDALLVRPDGALVHGHAISHLARRRTVTKWQFVQPSREEGILRVVRGANPPEYAAEFAADISAMLGGLPVRVEEVSELTTAKSGKFRYTIRDFPL